MNKKDTLTISSYKVKQNKHYSKTYNIICSLIVLLAVFTTGCKKDDFDGEITGVCPVVVSTDPMDKAVDVVTNKLISATFNTDMESSTISKTTFTIKEGTTFVSGTVSPTEDGKFFTFDPDVDLLPFTTYTGTITTGATDTLRTAMVSDYVWTFTTIPRVTLSENPTLSGTTAGGGDFAQGSFVTVTAVPESGFTFANWTDNGTVVSTSSSYQLTMAGNKALVANFTEVTAGNFAISLASSPAAGGTTNGAGSFAAGTPVTVTATPNVGYTFVNWTEAGAIVSPSSSYSFAVSRNRSLVANYTLIPVAQLAVVLSSSPPAGGTTTGNGSYTAGASVTVIATANNGYTFTNWTDNATKAIVSTSSTFIFPISVNTSLVANFALNSYTLNVTATNGSVVKNPNQPTYNHGSTVSLTATPNQGYIFSSWSGDATGSANPLTVIMNSNKNITANFIPAPTVGPAPINLGSSADFGILTKSGISTTGVTVINGNIGVSPAAATAITGFGLIMDSNNQSSTSPIVTGKVYASDYAAPTPAKMTTAVSDMETAFTTGNNLVTPAPIVALYAGDISGRTLPAGLYKWSTGVLITNAGVTLEGGPNDVWVFQIAQDLTVNSGIITLKGGAQAKNIFWVVSGQAILGTNTDFSGNILSKTLISLNTGAKVTGRLLAQTAVTLNTSTVIKP
ncbi:ice-binding family protein [Arcticibacter eurypsychrophilus]|uniref:ice-binding family protein n=1 Tax=Arcticibacter eurypsychrophilus TaxID=1434752 RepID=UPI00084DBF48|nr:ice-binding family protein [Arcticibacter eurypsychrophilus]